MNTTKNSRSTGAATAIILGFALALAPVTAHAGQTGAAATILPTGPDIALSATENLRQLIEADRGDAVVPVATEARTVPLRQLIEADRPMVAPQSTPDLREVPLRQLIEEDRAPEAAIPLLPPTEADRPSAIPGTADKTLRQLIEEDRR